MIKAMTVTLKLTLWLGAGLMLIGSVASAAGRNDWSVLFVRHTFNPQASARSMPEAPAAHVSASFWLAQDALNAGDLQRALELVREPASAGDPRALWLEGLALAKSGDFAGAVQLWADTGDYRALLNAGAQAAHEGRTADALLAYRTAWTVEPELSALSLAGFLLDTSKDVPGAEAVLRETLNAVPRSTLRATWYRRLGDTLRVQRRWEEALQAYHSGLALKPDDWAAHIGMGWTLYERGDGPVAALSEFRKAIDVDPKRGQGYLATAQLLTREKQYLEADEWFVQALAHNPAAASWYVARGNAARTGENYDLALQVYADVTARFPDFAPGYYETAWLYRLTGETQLAVDKIERALQLMAPPSEWYWVRAGQIYEWGDQPRAALNAYLAALQLNPGNRPAQDGAQRLAGQ